jgi:hypothetical protein
MIVLVNWTTVIRNNVFVCQTATGAMEEETRTRPRLLNLCLGLLCKQTKIVPYKKCHKVSRITIERNKCHRVEL